MSGALDPHEMAEQDRAFKLPEQWNCPHCSHGEYKTRPDWAQRLADHEAQCPNKPAPKPEDAEAYRNLMEAWQLTHGNRKASYGAVTKSFARYAKIWSGLLGDKLREDLTASDVALLMVGLKLAREMNKQQSDNVTDAHGYLILHDEIKADVNESLTQG